MNLLLVEDEAGIREGLTTYLQMKGYRVTAAESCAAGRTCLAAAGADYDLVITDWHLGDGLGGEIAALARCPVLVISGVKEDLEGQGLEVLRKPVMPARLVERIQAILAQETPEASAAAPAAPLPCDARDRVALIRALIESKQTLPAGSFEVLDDGTFVTVRAELDEEEPGLVEEMAWIGGDVRCLDLAGRPLLEVRFFRTSQRSDEDLLVGPLEPWPDGEATLAVDFDGRPECPPERLVELLRMATECHEAGRPVYFLNLPPHLRLHLELLGKAHAMPMREVAGPALPEVLSQLWG